MIMKLIAQLLVFKVLPIYLLLPSSSAIDENLIDRNSSHRDVHITLIGWRWDAVGKNLVVVVFFLLGAFAKIGYHNTRWLRTQIPESCVLIVLGSCVGLFLHFADISRRVYIPQFTPDKFFYFYLPPIILEAAYALYDRAFFNNIGTILLLAVVGTLINIFAIGLSLHICSTSGLYSPFQFSLIECFTFSTLISAVDPVAVIAIFQEVNVDKALYFLVFGESLLNDAVVVTMYNTMTTFAASSEIQIYHVFLAIFSFITVSGGGAIIGLLLGGFTSLVTKCTTHVRVIEPLVVILCAYSSYFIAELFHFSGIICLICCGLIQAAYVRHNVSSKSYITIKYLVKTLSSISDVIIFLFLGMVLIRDIHVWNGNFILSVLIFCTVYRFFSVYFLTYIANHFFHRLRSITSQEQFIMAYGGLRGAIAFALAIMLHPKDIPSVELFITATLVVIIFTVFVQGSTTKPIVRLLGLQTIHDEEAKLFVEISMKVIETSMNGFENIVNQTNFSSIIKKTLSNFNNNYFRKFLLKDSRDHWTVVRQTMSKIETSQDEKLFTVVKAIPERHSANSMIKIESEIGLEGKINIPRRMSLQTFHRPQSKSINFPQQLKVDSLTIETNGRIANGKIQAIPKLGGHIEERPGTRHPLTAVRRVSEGSIALTMRPRVSTDSNINDFREALNEAFGRVPYYKLPRTKNFNFDRFSSRRISESQE